MKKNLKTIFYGAIISIALAGCSDSNSSDNSNHNGINNGKIVYPNFDSAYLCNDINLDGNPNDEPNCVNVGKDGSYSLSNYDSTKPLVAIIQGVQKNNTVKNFLASPIGISNEVSIFTTYVKAEMDKDINLTYDEASKKVKQTTNIENSSDPKWNLLAQVQEAVFTNLVQKNENLIRNNIKGAVAVVSSKVQAKAQEINSESEINTIANTISQDPNIEEDIEKVQNEINSQKLTAQQIIDKLSIEDKVLDLTQYSGQQKDNEWLKYLTNGIQIIDTTLNNSFIAKYYKAGNYTAYYDPSNSYPNEKAFYVSAKACVGIIEGFTVTYLNADNLLSIEGCSKDMIFSKELTDKCIINAYNNGIKPVKYKWKIDTNKITNTECN